MTFDKITRTEKWNDVLKDDSQVILLEGPSQTSKTTLEAVKMMYEIFKSPKGETVVFLCGESTNTLYRNFVEKDVGIVNLFPYMSRYVADNKKGGERIEVIVPYHDGVETTYETKKIYFVGYSTINSENKLLGNKPLLIVCDEFNKAHDSFVKQVFTRVTAAQCKLIATTNGDVPDKLFYEYLNGCRPNPKYINEMPASTLNMMLEVKERQRWAYYFFGLNDRPNATIEWKREMMEMHPPGSFSYNCYVLGIRGYVEGALFAHLIKNEHTVREDKINYSGVLDIRYGMDVGTGAEIEGNAKTVVIPVAMSLGYQRIVVLDSIETKSIQHLEVIKETEISIQKMIKTFGYKVRGVRIDSAEATLIQTFRKNKRVGVPVDPSIKSSPIVNMKSRVTIIEQLLLKNRLLFANNEGAQRVKTNIMKLKGKNGEVVDENKLWNDYFDALIYSMTPVFNEIMTAKLR